MILQPNTYREMINLLSMLSDFVDGLPAGEVTLNVAQSQLLGAIAQSGGYVASEALDDEQPVARGGPEHGEALEALYKAATGEDYTYNQFD